MYKRSLGPEETKREAIKTARELFYGENVVRKIKEAKTINDIYRILNQARFDAE